MELNAEKFVKELMNTFTYTSTEERITEIIESYHYWLSAQSDGYYQMTDILRSHHSEVAEEVSCDPITPILWATYSTLVPHFSMLSFEIMKEELEGGATAEITDPL